MPRQQHYYGLNHAHFVTVSTYRRARLFDSHRFRLHFVGRSTSFARNRIFASSDGF
ncbi:MAG: hypothetical protein ACRD11_00255 [Terriglobia bacterium]